jgi:hypothetical protein
MLGKTTKVLCVALFLGAVFPASAATKHHRVSYGVSHDRRANYNSVPGEVSGGCPPSGGPTCSNAGPAPPDGW